MNDMKIEDRYKISEAAKLIGVSPVTVWRWCVAGKVANVLLPSGQRRIPYSEIVRLTTATKEQPEPQEA